MKIMNTKRTDVRLNVDERKLRLIADGVRQRIDTVFCLANHLQRGEIAHEVPWQNKGARNALGADVALNFGLIVEVHDMLEAAVGRLRDVKERRVDQMLDSGLRSDVGNVLAVELFLSAAS